jgi:very-short-patch-repair endonuclease
MCECRSPLSHARCVRRRTEILVAVRPPAGGELEVGPAGRDSEAVLRAAAFAPIDSLRPGDVVVTHWGGLRHVLALLENVHRGPIIGLRRRGSAATLWITPEHRIATPLPPLPRPETRRESVRMLRAEPTRSEEVLWQSLRGDHVAHRFRRQHPLGPFVVDFYCPSVRLAIEVDGSVHDGPDQQAYDRFRQEMIEAYRVVFLRVRSGEVERRPTQVLAAIAAAVARRAQSVCYDVCWVPARDLRVGAEVLHRGRRSRAAIESVFCEETLETVFDLAVQDDNSYVTRVSTVRSCCQ